LGSGIVWLLGETSGNVFCYFNLNTGVVGTSTSFDAASITSYPNGWYRCTATFTKTSATGSEDVGVGVTTVDGVPNWDSTGLANTQQVYLWGAQLEVGAFASAYQPTTTVGVARNASVDQYVSASNISATATSMTMEITPTVALGSTTVFHFGTYVDASNYTAILSDGTNLIARKRIAGVNTDATIAWTRPINTAAKVGARFDTTNGIDVWLNGTKGTGSATLTASQIGTNFQIGADGNGANQPFCAQRLDRAYTVSLSDSKMASLTT